MGCRQLDLYEKGSGLFIFQQIHFHLQENYELNHVRERKREREGKRKRERKKEGEKQLA